MSIRFPPRISTRNRQEIDFGTDRKHLRFGPADILFVLIAVGGLIYVFLDQG